MKCATSVTRTVNLQKGLTDAKEVKPKIMLIGILAGIVNE
jgi:hypothetical protein